MKAVYFVTLLGCLAMFYLSTEAQIECPIPDRENATLLPHPTSCTTYFACSNGEPIPMKCPEGLHFNAKLSVCDWPWRANCTAKE